jgi:hypothetical protein
VESKYAVLRIRDVYPIFSISDLGVENIPDPRSASKNLSILNQKFSTIRYGMFIPDPRSLILDLDFFPSRIPGSKKHWIPFLDPQHCKYGSGIALNVKMYDLDPRDPVLGTSP